MKLLIDLLFFVLLVLIKIGDAVIFLLKTLLKPFQKSYFLIKSPFKKKKKVKKKGVIFQIPRVGTWGKLVIVRANAFELILDKIAKIIRFALSLFFEFFKLIPKTILFPITFAFKKRGREKSALVHKKIKKIKRRSISSFAIKFKYFLAGGFFSFFFIFVPSLFFIFLQDLPNPHELSLRQIPQTTKIYDRNNTLLYQIYANQNRTLVPLESIPEYLREATIAVEDKDFYKHPGFNVLAITRSFIKNIQGASLQGGSTLTQQLIKSALLTPETSISRKTKEIILAFWAERIYSKNQILEMYFNQVPYGGTAWGAEAASELYFGKKVSDLNLSESAFLAGIPRAPTLYSPYGNYPNLWKKRQNEVLERMQISGYIDKKQKEQALAEKLVFKSPQVPIYAPHFVMYVKEYLIKKYGISAVEKGGLNVVTTLDLKTQETAQKIVADEVEKNAYLNLTNGAALVTTPKNGDILAMVGSRDYSYPENGNFNVTTSLRQPGSSIKVVTYSAALSKGFTAATILDDSPVVFSYPGAESYRPVNYDGKFHGKVSLRIALANSFNIPAVKTLNQIGIPTMVDMGKRMGIKNWAEPENYGLSITLGAAETTMIDMATVYGVLANQGERVDLNPILKLTDYKGNILEEKDGLRLFGKKIGDESFGGLRVLDKGVTFILSSILSDNPARAMEFGTNSPLNIPGHTVSVKTGTSDNKRDNWTIGYTPSFVVTVWVGNNDNSPMSQRLASGITGAAPIWNRTMSFLLENRPNEKYPVPDDVIQKNCIGRMEYFIKGTENSVNCAFVPKPSEKPKD